MLLARLQHGILIPILLLVLGMISLQGGASLAKSLFAEIGSEGVTAMRLGISALLLTLFFKPWKHQFNRENLRYLFAYGISLGFMNFLFYQSLQTLPIGIAVALEFTGPLAVALYSSRRRMDFVWLGFIVLGLYFLLPRGEADHIDLVGALYALGAGVCWAIYIIYGQKAGFYYGSATAPVGTIISAAIFFPVGLIKSGTVIFTPSILPLAFAVALFSSAIPYALEMIALTRLPRKTFGALASLEPAVGALSGLIFLGEALTLMQWCALGAIIIAAAGVALSAESNQQERVEPESTL